MLRQLTIIISVSMTALNLGACTIFTAHESQSTSAAHNAGNTCKSIEHDLLSMQHSGSQAKRYGLMNQYRHAGCHGYIVNDRPVEQPAATMPKHGKVTPPAEQHPTLYT